MIDLALMGFLSMRAYRDGKFMLSIYGNCVLIDF